MLALAAKTAEAMETATGQWGPFADVRRSLRQGEALVVAVKVRDEMKVHHVLADPSEEMTQNTVQAIEIVTTGQWVPCEVRLQVKAKPLAVQFIDGPGKTNINGVCDEDLGVKPDEDESVGVLCSSKYRSWSWSSSRHCKIAEIKFRRRRRTTKREHERRRQIPQITQT